jgi:hypothetical protein
MGARLQTGRSSAFTERGLSGADYVCLQVDRIHVNTWL